MTQNQSHDCANQSKEELYARLNSSLHNLQVNMRHLEHNSSNVINSVKSCVEYAVFNSAM